MTAPRLKSNIPRERTVPAFFSQHLLELDRAARQTVRVVEPLGAFRPVGQRDHQGEPVAFDLLPDLAAQMLSSSFVEPDHATGRRKNRSA